MLRHLPKLFVFALLAGAAWWLWPASELRHAPGVRIVREPEQLAITPRALDGIKRYTITAVASYAIEARVLHTKRYWARGDDLVPYDVAVGWGAMSDQAVLDQLALSRATVSFSTNGKLVHRSRPARSRRTRRTCISSRETRMLRPG